MRLLGTASGGGMLSGARVRFCWRAEDGRVGMLFTVLIGVVAALCLVAANISHVHLQHRRGLACADSVALAGASVVNGGDYFCPTCAGSLHPLAVAGVQHEATAALSRLSASTCDIGAGVTMGSVLVDGQDVSVTLRVATRLALVPPVIDGIVAPRITVVGKARLVDP